MKTKQQKGISKFKTEKTVTILLSILIMLVIYNSLQLDYLSKNEINLEYYEEIDYEETDSNILLKSNEVEYIEDEDLLQISLSDNLLKGIEVDKVRLESKKIIDSNNHIKNIDTIISIFVLLIILVKIVKFKSMNSIDLLGSVIILLMCAVNINSYNNISKFLNKELLADMTVGEDKPIHISDSMEDVIVPMDFYRQMELTRVPEKIKIEKPIVEKNLGEELEINSDEYIYYNKYAIKDDFIYYKNEEGELK